MGFYARTLADYDGETGVIKVHTTPLNASNMADQLTLQATFGAAINDMVRGTLQRISYGNEVNSPTAAPDDVFAQREMKWKVNARDTVNGKAVYFTVPTADMSLLDPNNRGYADMDNAAVQAFVAAAEAYVLSVDGNAIAIDDIVLVGRNI